MGRKTWVKPMTMVQKFEANEAITACLQVVCQMETEGSAWAGDGFLTGTDTHPEVDGSDPWGRDEWLGSVLWNLRKHDGYRCKDPNNSGVFISNNGEISFADGCWRILHVDSDGDNLADIGERIYWCEDKTEKVAGINYTYKYNHWGTVEKSSNRS